MRKIWLALATLPLLTGGAPANSGLSDKEVREFLFGSAGFLVYDPQPLKDWEAGVYKALEAKNADAQIAALAARYGVTPKQMATLIGLWVRADATEMGFDDDRAGVDARRAAIRQGLLALLAETGRSDLMIQAVAGALDKVEGCNSADFDALIAGASDPGRDAWMIAASAPCGENLLRAAGAGDAPHLVPLIALADFGSLSPADALALRDWLLRPAQLQRVDPTQRDAVTAHLVHRQVDQLLDVGQADSALALFDGQPPAVAALLRGKSLDALTLTIDGRSLELERQEKTDPVRLRVAAAFAVRGRRAEAEAMLRDLGGMAAARHRFDCAVAPLADGKSPKGCDDRDFDNSWIDYVAIDHLLNRADADPYPIAEAGFASMHSGGGIDADLGCRLFDPAGADKICITLRRSVVYAIDGGHSADADSRARQTKALLDLKLPGFSGSRDALVASLDATRARLNADSAVADGATGRDRASRDPEPPFAAQPLPARWLAAPARPAPLPKTAAALPPDFIPLRFESAGTRAVAVSLSQNYDPSGEVSGGGYWIHLSDDGGKSWQAPLYTGLADRFPYVVPANSRMPLLGTDGAINLEVEVALLDTASITYPPVALATRRTEKNLYIVLPFDDLARDGDGDGFTDIAERHLLLDTPGDEAPMLVGSQGAAACGPLTNEQGARIALLDQLFEIKARPIVEPLDMAGSDPDVRFGQWSSAATGPSRAVFLLGDPADFACLRSDRPIIVYSPRHIAALATRSPDFRAVEMPAIVFNRARDRGYAIWSAGWTGGTFRLRFENNRWQIDSIGNWIT